MDKKPRGFLCTERDVSFPCNPRRKGLEVRPWEYHRRQAHVNSESSPSLQKAQLQYNPSTPGLGSPPYQSLQSTTGWRRARCFEISQCELHRKTSASSLSSTCGSPAPSVGPRGSKQSRAGCSSTPGLALSSENIPKKVLSPPW